MTSVNKAACEFADQELKMFDVIYEKLIAHNMLVIAFKAGIEYQKNKEKEGRKSNSVSKSNKPDL